MTFDSQTVRSVGNAYFQADFDVLDGDCFLFGENAVPNIISFSETSECALSGHTCDFDGTQFKIQLNSDLSSGTEITISDFNYLEFAYPAEVQVFVNYLSQCTGIAVSFVTFIETAFTIQIDSTHVEISSDSNVVGDSSQSLSVVVTDVTVPSEGKILFSLPKQFGSTSMVSTSSCNLFVYSGLLSATCENVSFGTNGEEIEILFTANEGNIDFEFQITDFDNPYTTSEWGLFGIEIQQYSVSEDDFFGVSSGTEFKMTALTDPYTISASIDPLYGVIEEIDTIEIQFEIIGAKILENCQFEIVLPPEIGFDSGSAKIQGKGCFAYSTGTTSMYVTLSTSSKFTFTWPSSGGGGIIRGEGLCPSQIYDLECYMKVTGVIMPEYVQTTQSIKFFLYDSGDGLIGQQISGLSIQESQLVAGDVTLNYFTSDNSEVQESGVTFTISFTPEHIVLDTTKIIIDFPSDIPLEEYCIATSSSMDDDTSTCTSNQIVFLNPFLSNKGAGYEIVVEISTGTNPQSVKDAGTISIQIQQQDDSLDYQLKNRYNDVSEYLPSQGSILKASSQTTGGAISVSSYQTFQEDVIYNIFLETEHDVEAQGYLIISLPTEISTSGSGTTSNCLFNSENPESCSVDSTNNLITIKLKTTQSITRGEEISIQFGGIINPRTLQTTNYFVIYTQDSSMNMIDSSSSQFSIQMTQMSEFTQFLVQMDDKTNLAISNYTISFQTTFPLMQDDVLYITFPSELELQDDTICEPVKNIGSLLCSNTGNQLSIEFDQINDSDGIGDFSILIYNITNPPSTTPTSPFSDILLVSEFGASIATYTIESISVNTKYAAELTEYSLDQSSYEPSESATYILSFTPNSVIPKYGIFIISYPDSLELTSRSGCRVSGPTISANLCTISQISGQIIIERAFIGHVEGYSGEITVEKDYFVNMDSNHHSNAKSFTIRTYTDQTKQYLIDELTEGMIPTLQCSYPCKDCSDGDQDYCLSCYTENENPFLQAGECVSSCEYGYSANGEDEKVCQPCDESCQGCFDNGLTDDRYRCQVCSDNYDMTFEADHRCFKECTFGFFELNKKQCGKCQEPCLNCEGDQNYCTACDVNSEFTMNLDGQCLSSCPDGYGSIGQKCVKCTSPCSTCTSSPSQCTSCNGKSGKAWLFNSKCYDDCPFGTTKNSENKVCTGCFDGCKVCSSEDQTQCLLCKAPLLVFDGDCLASCPGGYSVSYDGKSCVDGLVDFPVIYFPNIIIACFLCIAVAIGYCKQRDTLILTNIVLMLGIAEKLSYFTQLVSAFQLSAEKHGSTALLAFICSIVLNMAWYWYMKNKIRDPSFKLWQQDYQKASLFYQRLGAIFSFKLTRLHICKFAGLNQCKAGFTDPNIIWRPLIFFTIAQGLLVQFPFVISDLVGLSTMEQASQLYYCMIETLILIIVQSFLQIIELYLLRGQLGEEYKPVPIDTQINKNSSPQTLLRQQQLLNSLLKRMGEDGKNSPFVKDDVKAKCLSERVQKQNLGSDERTVKSNHGSPTKNKNSLPRQRDTSLLDQSQINKSAIFLQLGANEESKQDDSTKIFLGKSPEVEMTKAKNGWDMTTGSEFKRAINAKKTTSFIIPEQPQEPDDEAEEEEYLKNRLRKKRGRGRNNVKIGIEEKINDMETQRNQILPQQPAQITEESLADVKLTIEEEFKQKESSLERKKKSKDELKKLKELEKLKKKEDKANKEAEKKKKKEEEKVKKEQLKQAQNKENEIEKARMFHISKQSENPQKEQYQTADTAQTNLKQQTAPQPLASQFYNNVPDDESRGDRSTTTIASKAMMLQTEKTLNPNGSPPISFLKIHESSMMGNTSNEHSTKAQKNVQLLARQENFNENEVLGDLDRDSHNNVVIPSIKIDKQGRKINQKGYLINQKGDIIGKTDGNVKFNKKDLSEEGELPTAYALDRFNFNAHVLFNNKKLQTDQNGNVIDAVTKQVKLNACFLTKENQMPKMFSYAGRRFDLREIMGEFDKENNGELCFQEDPSSGQLKDKHGNLVNYKGYLIDGLGNIINQIGEKIFAFQELEQGEIPKIFSFTKFTPKKLLGKFEVDIHGLPILQTDSEGRVTDDAGNLITTKGYRCDSEGNIIEPKSGNIIFKQSTLDKGDIPKVFRTGLIKAEASPITKLMESIERSVKKEKKAARPKSSPSKHVHRGQAPGDSSEEEGMGVTPSDFNFLNQRQQRELLDVKAESIEEDSIEEESKRAFGEQRTRKEIKRKGPAKMYVDPVDAQISNVYGGPRPKAINRKPQLGHKSIVEENPKFQQSKTFTTAPAGLKDITNSQGPIILNGVLEQKKDLMTKRKQTIAKKGKKNQSIESERDDIGKNIEDFLENDDWEMQSMANESANRHSRDSSRSNFDQRKFNGLKKVYLQNVDPKQKDRKYKSQVRNNPGARREEAMRPMDTLGDEAPIKSTKNQLVHKKKVSQRDGSVKTSDKDNIFPKVGGNVVLKSGHGWM